MTGRIAEQNETEKERKSKTAQEDAFRAQLAKIKRAFASKPFTPHSLFRNGHAQTLAAYAWPRRKRLLRAHHADQARMFEIAKNVQLLAHCHWQTAPTKHPTLLLAHGLEGSSASPYMLGTGEKAFRAGFNVVRLNLRNCGGTEHLTPTLYNSGLSTDVYAVLTELIERDALSHIFLAGFSLSGNIVLKLAGELGANAPRALVGICAVSPSVDLHACADAIERRANWIYQKNFMRSLRRRIRRKRELFPELYNLKNLREVRTIRDFDERFTARDGGYKDAKDYYTRASSLSLLRYIHVPTLLIHAQDDPFIPFTPLNQALIADDNPYLLLLAPRHGGHVGFIATRASREEDDEDHFWAENRVVEFCRLLDESFKP
jgi:predicted alpha/beta-fold hydrolase